LQHGTSRRTLFSRRTLPTGTEVCTFRLFSTTWGYTDIVHTGSRFRREPQTVRGYEPVSTHVLRCDKKNIIYICTLEDRESHTQCNRRLLSLFYPPGMSQFRDMKLSGAYHPGHSRASPPSTSTPSTEAFPRPADACASLKDPMAPTHTDAEKKNMLRLPSPRLMW